MKKSVAILLLALLALSLFTASAEPYTFANGVHWHMTRDEVWQIEGMEPDAEILPEEGMAPLLSEYNYYEVKVSRYTATKAYMFAADDLFTLVYFDFSENTPEALQYLRGALTQLYGDAGELDTEILKAWFGDMTGKPDEYSFSDAYTWSVDDDTEIRLYMVSMFGDIKIYLQYLATDFDDSAIWSYDTTNL